MVSPGAVEVDCACCARPVALPCRGKRKENLLLDRGTRSRRQQGKAGFGRKVSVGAGDGAKAAGSAKGQQASESNIRKYTHTQIRAHCAALAVLDGPPPRCVAELATVE